MEEQLTGIVISSKDYKEKDKLITLFSAEKGLVNLILRGVKSPKAKLKMAKEIFCFGTYSCIFKSDLGVVIGCEIIDNFSSLAQNIDKYVEACSILSTVKNLSKYNQADLPLFFELMNALKTLTYDATQKNIVLCRFLIAIFQSMGYKLNLDYCSVCYNDLNKNIYLNIDTGEICCEDCSKVGINTLKIEVSTHKNLRLISIQDYNNIKSIEIKNLDECLKILSINFEQRFFKKLFTM